MTPFILKFALLPDIMPAMSEKSIDGRPWTKKIWVFDVRSSPEFQNRISPDPCYPS